MGYTNLQFQEKIVEPIKSLIMHSMIGVKDKLNQDNRQYCFEIFGYDFILDDEENVFLIEVNTNPCLEKSSGILEVLLPRMIGIILNIDDAFKLTLDVIFPVKEKDTVFNVPFYSDHENIWYYNYDRELLTQLNPKESQKKEKNNKHFLRMK